MTDLSNSKKGRELKTLPYSGKFVFGKIAVVENGHPGGATEVKFVFNPSKLTLSATAKWEQPAQAGNKAAAPPTYKGPDPQSLDIEFTLDGWERSGTNHTEPRNVTEDLKTLISWTRPTKPAVGAKKPKPPLVKLMWGPPWFTAYVASVNSTITMFDSNGFALRATVKVTLKEVPRDGEGPNPTSGSRVGHQSHVVTGGESLPHIANRYYDKPGYWRGLAMANNIDDPSRIRGGMRLYLPPLEDVAEASR
jgi:nucleoid-associated protein YgaU